MLGSACTYDSPAILLACGIDWRYSKRCSAEVSGVCFRVSTLAVRFTANSVFYLHSSEKLSEFFLPDSDGAGISNYNEGLSDHWLNERKSRSCELKARIDRRPRSDCRLYDRSENMDRKSSYVPRWQYSMVVTERSYCLQSWREWLRSCWGHIPEFFLVDAFHERKFIWQCYMIAACTPLFISSSSFTLSEEGRRKLFSTDNFF